jgi:hypothetical protein
MKFPLKKQLFTILLILVEAYRVGSGTLLVLFVPGVCGDKACLPTDNYQNGTVFYRGIVFLNLATLLFFLALYGIEIRREFRLHTYLRFDDTLPTDSKSVEKTIETLQADKKVKLDSLLQVYKAIGSATVCMFIVNTVLSGYIILTQYANDKGPVLFATNTLFISGKLYDIYTNVMAEKGVYLSAYRKKHTQFNGVNPEKLDNVVTLF